MPIKITYFAHGTTTDNEKGISSGWYDVGLSELGVKQSIELGEKMTSSAALAAEDVILKHKKFPYG